MTDITLTLTGEELAELIMACRNRRSRAKAEVRYYTKEGATKFAENAEKKEVRAAALADRLTDIFAKAAE
jgi:hypothetical protein